MCKKKKSVFFAVYECVIQCVSLGYSRIGQIQYCMPKWVLKFKMIHSMTILKQLQWGKKVFSQPPIVQVLPLKKMREACNFHHRYTSTMTDKMRKKRKSRKSHCRIFYELICKLWWKISIWSIT